MKGEINSSFGKELSMNEKTNRSAEINTDFKSGGAKENLDLIKTTINKSKYNLNHLFMHLISFAFVSLLFNALILRQSYSYRENDDVETFIRLGFPVFTLILLIFYIKKSRLIKKTQGDYTVQLYSLWGYALFLPPLVNASRFILASSKVVVYYDVFMSILSLSFLLAAILITGILVKNKILTAVGIASPIISSVYMILRLSFGLSFKVNSFVYHAEFVIRQMTILTIIVTVLYLAAAIFFKVKGEFFSNEENA